MTLPTDRPPKPSAEQGFPPEHVESALSLLSSKDGAVVAQGLALMDGAGATPAEQANLRAAAAALVTMQAMADATAVMAQAVTVGDLIGGMALLQAEAYGRALALTAYKPPFEGEEHVVVKR